MIVEFIKDNNIDELKFMINKVARDAKSILILSCDENDYDVEEVNHILKSCSIPIIGGIFPQIIFQNKNYTQGTIVASIKDTLDVTLIENISEKSVNNFEEIIEEKVGEMGFETQTMFVFVDGLSKNINAVIMGLFENYGLSINYIGGGTGSLTFEQKPSVFTNNGLMQDCAVVATTTLKSSIGVKHGWEAISEPMNVTLSEANIIKEIGYKPAFEVYKEIVESASNRVFNDDNFFDIAKSYPLGIDKLSGDRVVRDPIMLDEDKNLVCVGDIATNSFISILNGTNESLVTAATQAKNETSMGEPNFTLFIDCISRVLFMDDEFSKELNAIYEEGDILIGALTLGEIANNKKYYLEFYNKTAVVAKIQK